MKTKNIRFRQFMCDLETVVYPGQEKTEAWAAGQIELTAPDDPDYCLIYNSLDKLLKAADKMLYKNNIKQWYHNEKFDGSFIMSWLLRHEDYVKPWIDEDGHLVQDIWSELPEGHFTYSVSKDGEWYHITLKKHGHFLRMMDSYKLLPFSVEKIGEAFETKHRKLSMEYIGERHAGGVITAEEEEYLKNDLLVVKEAMNFMHSQGFNKSTISACCMSIFKNEFVEPDMWNIMFPEIHKDTHDIPSYTDVFSQETKPFKNWDEYLRRAYTGAWTYVVPEKAGRTFKHGCTLDVNSLYAYVMYSGHKMPVGVPHYFKCENNEIPDQATKNGNRYYFIRLKTRFKLKEGMLPTLQIKDFYPIYHPREWLKTSDHLAKNGKYYATIPFLGNPIECRPELILTMTDYEMLKEHYDLYDTELIDGAWFFTEEGIFDKYIDKYMAIKMTEKGPRRQLAKLCLVSLYGKFATSPDSSYKMFYLNKDGVLRGQDVKAYNKQPIYIPIAAAITSYARCYTITAAQKNYNGADPGLIYSDTDSMHLDISPEEVKGVEIDAVKLGCWKCETEWDMGKVVRAKTYIEHVIKENFKDVEPYYNLKCAGMPDRAKNILIKSVTKDYSNMDNYDEEEQEFIKAPHTWDYFDYDMNVPGVLKGMQIPGGIVLMKSNYIMKQNFLASFMR